MRLFHRVAKVSLTRKASGFVATNPGFFDSIGDTVEITDLRMQFKVSKSLAKEPNKCEITITNLSDHSRGELEKKPIEVQLAAGYDGAPRLLFRGDLRYGPSKLEGTDWTTTIQVADGARAISHARMSKSYKPPIRVSQVLSDVAASMDMVLPPEVEQSSELKQALANGISTHGPTRDILTRLLAPYGYNWSVQNGELQILKDGDVRKGDAILINEAAGLISSPERTVPEKPGAKSELTFQILLYPELAPGQLIKVESRDIDGQFRIQEVEHSGDSWGDGEDSWTSSVKARPL